MEFLSLFIYWSGIFLCLPCAFLLLEVAAGLIGRGSKPDAGEDRISGAVLLIPAHDEAALLGKMLGRLPAVDTDGVRTVVLADNCSDATAAIALEAGVEVWERRDKARRGKPFALSWALERLEADPPKVVVFLDADSWFENGSPARLASLAATHGRPVQAIYRMDSAGLRGFAFRFRNEVRLRGLQALGAPTQLTGSGFAIPWKLLRQFPVPTGELVEDALWGWTFTCAGVGPMLATDVEVLSDLPESKQGAMTQRRRWEHGILSATLRSLPSLLRSAVFPPRLPRILHLCDVLIPPLALLGLSCLAILLGGLIAPTLMTLTPVVGAICLLAMAVLLGWWAYGRAELPFLHLLASPFYALGKIGVYASFFFRRQRDWRRTERNENQSGETLGED